MTAGRPNPAPEHEPLRLLHVFPSFAPGGAQMRTIDLMAGLGSEFTHQVAALDGQTSATSSVAPGVRLELVEAPPRAAAPVRAHLFRRMLARLRPDLLLTYNWGAIEAAMGASMASGVPFVHAEDGFGADESERLKARRVWTRAVVLRRARAVVVPSRTLERIALHSYRLPRNKVLYVPNGIDTVRFQPRSESGAKAAFGLDPASPVVGAVGHLRPEKNLELMLRALALMRNDRTQLLIVGGGPCLPGLREAASSLNLAGRVVFAGPMADPAPAYAAMDLFALSSSTEQMPVALLEAMASGLAAVCTNVGDCAVMLDRNGPPSIVPPGDAAALAGAFDLYADDSGLRLQAGRANLALCRSRFSRDEMIERYRRLYRWAAGGGARLEFHA